MNCRLCNSARSAKLCSDDARSYFHCEKCGLIFVPESEHVSVHEEKKRYALHDNSAANIGYVKFLGDMVKAVSGQCGRSGRVLDHGSGKNSVLTRLLKEKGYNCTAYDPLYHIGKEALSKTYDTVVLCEVVEHLRDLRKEAFLIKKVAGNTGKILIRTRLYPSLDTFAGWWYKNDITHINFFGRETIDVMAGIMGREKVGQEAGDIFTVYG